eukprot:5832592-Prymnesium_polylepis.1
MLALLALSLTWYRRPYVPAAKQRAYLQLSHPSDPVEAAVQVLSSYDASHRAAAASAGAKGFGGAITANEWAAAEEQPPLAEAVSVLVDAAVHRSSGGFQQATAIPEISGRLALGICASDATAGIQALKAWVTALGLPKGPLHGMDKGGVPLDMSTFGAVYIKYNSRPGSAADPPGTAVLSGYTGDFRG